MRGKKGPMGLLRFQGLQKQVFASPDAKLYGPSLSVSRHHGMLLGRRLKVGSAVHATSMAVPELGVFWGFGGYHRSEARG